MKLKNYVCTRAQAIDLRDKGILNSCITEGGDPIPGIIYSVILISNKEERVYPLGTHEDAPYDHYKPVRLYNTLELLTMFGPCKLSVDKHGYRYIELPDGSAWGGPVDYPLPQFLAGTLYSALVDKVITVEEANQRLMSLT